tara:strand:+ start:366 stop:1223 length:858 start_codon:yes stop_codon:yes gene_type:complete
VNKIIHGDCLNVLPEIQEQSVNCCVTSPPYWGLRDYGAEGQLGLEATPDEYVAKMVETFAEVRRVLRDDGTVWLNLGDSYNNYRPMKSNDNRAHKFGGKRKTDRGLPDNNLGSKRGVRQANLKEKDLVGIPWKVAFALQADGWYLRQDIIWHKPNPMPESVRDRCTKAHEYIFLLSKNEKYYYDADSIKEPSIDAPEGGRNKRSVWTVNTKPFKGAHFATFPTDLILPCILAGCPEGGVVLDPFMGAGTTADVARKLGRNYLGVELNQEYIDLAHKRLEQNLLAI